MRTLYVAACIIGLLLLSSAARGLLVKRLLSSLLGVALAMNGALARADVAAGTQDIAIESSGSTSVTLASFDPGSGSDMVLIAVHWVFRGGRTSNSCDYDSGGTPVAFTKLGNQTIENASTHDTALYILLDANIQKSTAVDITCDHAGGGSARQSVAVGVFTGVDQANANDAFQSAASTSEALSITTQTVTSESGDMVTDAVNVDDDDGPVPAAGAGQTEWTGSAHTNVVGAGGASYAPGGGSVDMDWSGWDEFKHWAWVGVNLNAAGGGASAAFPTFINMGVQQ